MICSGVVGALSTLEFLICALALEIYQWCTRDLDKSCHEMQTGWKSDIKTFSNRVEVNQWKSGLQMLISFVYNTFLQFSKFSKSQNSLLHFLQFYNLVLLIRMIVHTVEIFLKERKVEWSRLVQWLKTSCICIKISGINSRENNRFLLL